MASFRSAGIYFLSLQFYFNKSAKLYLTRIKYFYLSLLASAKPKAAGIMMLISGIGGFVAISAGCSCQ
ncbi:MAG TPA: hypothetical protein DER33_04815 [Syntrophomonas sp.]|nr:hypothetical protein [Syntrophomonas sp.]